MKEELRKIFQRQHYKIVGNHSGVKLCHWLRQKLFYGRICYKELFYGISTHRCLQFTPTITQCTQNCLYCWRYQKFTTPTFTRTDNPEVILEKSIEAQRVLLSGFKGDKRCNLALWQEAQNPNHLAISLAGEPTLYQNLNELLELCEKKKFTTFLVTNGTVPKALERLTTLPTQLYLTLSAPNEELYKKLCLPLLSDCWKKIKISLKLLRALSTRTVIRHTLVEGWNLGYEEEYANLDSLAEADFIECKAYMFVGYSRHRLNLANMPSHEKIKVFADKLATLLGYKVIDEKKDSRVVLLGKSLKSKIA
jgi:tRNA wybutosine-synthesizing protein 1